MRAGTWILVSLLLLVPASTLAAPDLGSDQQREEGKELYDKYCAQCHGVTGDGNGHATGRVKPAPRDFISGKYKFRTTPSGMLPTDDDIRRVIRDGLPYTSMPGWPESIFSDAQVQDIIYYLKSFSEDFKDESKYADSIDIPSPPPITEESIAKGREVYEAQGCKACHGDLGRGDGLSAPTLTDDWGDHIPPADMSQRWTFRGGSTRKDMFRTFSTGLNGTPMPSYFESVEVEDRWHLVNYMTTLGDGEDPSYSELLNVAFLDDDIDVSRGAELFESAPLARFPLMGQIVEPGRSFFPWQSQVMVQAVYNRNEIAFLVRWNDMRAEDSGMNAPDMEIALWDDDQPDAPAGDEDEGGFWGDEVEEDESDIWGDEAVDEDEGDFWGEEEDSGGGGAAYEFSDAVALQFPSTMPSGIRKPYFIFGDTQNSVDLWFLDLARPAIVRQYIGRGSDNLELQPKDEFEVSSHYENGEWQVIFKRDLRSDGNISIAADQFVPIAFSVWDGFNRERGNKRAFSAWFYLYTEPMTEVSATLPMVRAGLIALVVELVIIFWIRRRFTAGTSAPDTGRGGAVPHGGLAK